MWRRKGNSKIKNKRQQMPDAVHTHTHTHTHTHGGV